MQLFMKKDDKSLIAVETVETTGERCCQSIVYVHRNEAHYKFMYIIPM